MQYPLLRFAFFVGLLAAGPSAPSVAAQEPAVRAALGALRDSLAAVTDSAAAARLERRLERAAGERPGDPVLRLRQGLAALRHAELGNAHRFVRARSAFGRAADIEPAWPWPRYAYALAEAGRFEDQRSDSLEIGKRIGVGHLASAVGALAEAVALDPAFVPALVELERLAWRLHEPENWEAALAAFRGVPAARRGEPALELALARLEREIGNPDSALAALRRYERLGGSAAVARLEEARTRLQRGLPGGIDAYFAGAALDDSAAVAGYRADLALIVADSVLAEFDAAAGADRAAVLRRFWSDRARIDLRDPEDRLREHYRRLQHARRHFSLSITRRHQRSDCPYASGSMEFDDRGIIYLRHGEPTRRIRPVLFTVMPNESWRYERADGDLVFHFGAGMDIYDYRLLESVADVLGRCSNAGATSPPPLPDVWLSRDELDPMYARLAAWSGTGAGERLMRQERRIGAASIATGTTTDSHALRFERPLDAAVDVVAVGRRGDRTIAHVVFAVRGGRTAGEAAGGAATADGPTGGEWRYAVRVRAAAYGSDRRVAGYLDSTVTYVMPVPLDSTRHLFGRVELPLPPGTWQVRTAIALNESAGAVLPTDSVRVAPAAPRDLTLSDLVVGWRPIRLTWARGADTVYFSPFRSYFADAELELYYEIGGLRPGLAYEARLEIVARSGGGLFRRRPPGVRLGFRDVADADRASARRTVRLADLRPGDYWLDVVITDELGRTARRRVEFQVESRD